MSETKENPYQAKVIFLDESVMTIRFVRFEDRADCHLIQFVRANKDSTQINPAAIMAIEITDVGDAP